MEVNEQNRLRVRLSQVYWGNHPLLRNGADTWRTPPYQTPLNRWTTKPAKPGHGQPCRGWYMVWTHRSLDMYRWHHPKHHSFPKYPFKIFKIFVHIKHSVPWWTGTVVELEAKGQASAQSFTGTVTLGANKKKKKIMVNEWFSILVILGNLEILEILDNLDILR